MSRCGAAQCSPPNLFVVKALAGLAGCLSHPAGLWLLPGAACTLCWRMLLSLVMDRRQSGAGKAEQSDRLRISPRRLVADTGVEGDSGVRGCGSLVVRSHRAASSVPQGTGVETSEEILPQRSSFEKRPCFMDEMRLPCL